MNDLVGANERPAAPMAVNPVYPVNAAVRSAVDDFAMTAFRNQTSRHFRSLQQHGILNPMSPVGQLSRRVNEYHQYEEMA